MMEDSESGVEVVKCERKNKLQQMIQAEWAVLGTSWIDVRGENDRDVSCTEILNQHTTASPRLAC